MPSRVDYEAAGSVLEDALAHAIDQKSVPVEWVSYARSVFALDAKTWTPALGTILLAKSVNSQIDTMSLKVDPKNDYSYSARTLCHKVLVPAAVEHNFSIRNTGREPLNNQPFFRYLRLDELDRVKNPADRDFFVDIAEKAATLSSQEAASALSAFLKVALEDSSKIQNIKIKSDGLTFSAALNAVADFLRTDAHDRPRRLQAFGAACLDLIFHEVKSRRINDPSTDLPGDVQVFVGTAVTHAMEVRGKPVSDSELAGCVRACSAAQVQRAIMFVDSDYQQPLNLVDLTKLIEVADIQVAVFTSAEDLLGSAALWPDRPLAETIENFGRKMLERLREIELKANSLEEWARAVAISRGR